MQLAPSKLLPYLSHPLLRDINYCRVVIRLPNLFRYLYKNVPSPSANSLIDFELGVTRCPTASKEVKHNCFGIVFHCSS